jgi:hypothetical protein
MSRHLGVVVGRPALLVAAAVTLALAFTGCDATKVSDLPEKPKGLVSPTGPPDGLDAEGASAWTLWQEKGWANYSYRLSVLCFCDHVMKAPVEVKAGKVVRFEGKPLAPDQQVTGFGRKPPTINALFVELGQAIADADEVTVDYDEKTGVPIRISVDWFTDSLDDEISYSATQVTPTN